MTSEPTWTRPFLPTNVAALLLVLEEEAIFVFALLAFTATPELLDESQPATEMASNASEKM